MEVVYRGAQTGKTTYLIEVALRYGATIVVPGTKERENIEWLCKKQLRKAPPPCITLSEFISRKWIGKDIRCFVIDDAEHVLFAIANGVPIVAISMCDESQQAMESKTDEEEEYLAHVGYQGYGNAAVWKNYLGKPMPAWKDLPENIRGYWVAAAEAIQAELEK